MIFFVQLLFLISCFNSLVFASKPTNLATTATVHSIRKPIGLCQIKSHTDVLAERKKIAAAIAKVQEESILLPPLIQIVASYCATPMSWQKKQELRLPDDECLRYVNSIAQLSADKIAVSYAPANEQPVREHTVKVSHKAAIWDLQQKDSAPDCQTFDTHADSKLVGLSERFIALYGSVVNNGHLYDVQTKTKQDITGDGPLEHSRIIALAALSDSSCAVATNGGRLHRVEIESDTVLRFYRYDMTILEQITEITALCALPDNRVAVGTSGGYLAMVSASGEWDYFNDSMFRQSIEQIVVWPNGIIASLVRIHLWPDFVEYHEIQCWNIHTKKKIRTIKHFLPILNICALPNGRIAVTSNESPINVKIYSIGADLNTSDLFGEVYLEQEILFGADNITSLPFFLAKSTRPAMVIGKSCGAVQILEEELCKDCESVKKINT